MPRQKLAERLLGEVDADVCDVGGDFGIAVHEQLQLAGLRAGMIELEHAHAGELDP